MKLAVVVGDSPADVIRMMPAWTDARRAVPGLSLTVFGSPLANAVASRHEAVLETVDTEMADWAKPWWSPRLHGARRALARALEGIEGEAFSSVLDPLGSEASSALASRLPGTCCGLGSEALADPALKKRYQSRFPIPEHLHPVQRHRVLFAAVLDYSIHDLKPDYGVRVASGDAQPPRQSVLIALEPAPVGWTPETVDNLRAQLKAEAVEPVELLPEAPDSADLAQGHFEPRDAVNSWWTTVAESAYVIASDTATAHLAAALGRPGLMLCEPGAAPTTGAISCRHASQAMVSLDEPRMTQVDVIAAATLKALRRLENLDPAQA